MPGFDPALFNRGCARRLLGDHDEAIADFTEFIQRRPQNAQAHYHRGLAHFDKGDYDSAIADFTHAFNLDPNLSKAWSSCLEVTRIKYEKQLALVAVRQRQPARPAPVSEAARVESKPETQPFQIPDEATLVEEHSPPEKEELKEEPPPEPPAKKKVAAEKPPPRLDPSEEAREKSAAPPTAGHLEGNLTGKLPLECPDCGMAGLYDVRNLNKMFRCPGCSTWWRTSVGGQLTRVAGPASESQETDTSRSKKRAAKSSKSSPTPQPITKSAKNTTPAKNAKPAPRRSDGEGRLRTVGLWIVEVAKMRSARWGIAASLLVLLFLVPVLFPSLFPSKLKKRGEQATQAWLAKDIDQIKQFVEPSQTENVARWLEESPPPDVVGQEPPARVNVAVQRNDGRTAVIVIQIKAKKKDGGVTFFVFRHNWVSKGGVWYIRPNLSGIRTAGG